LHPRDASELPMIVRDDGKLEQLGAVSKRIRIFLMSLRFGICLGLISSQPSPGVWQKAMRSATNKSLTAPSDFKTNDLL
jgi:hypothetical protein